MILTSKLYVICAYLRLRKIFQKLLSADYEYSDDSADEDYQTKEAEGNVGAVEAQKAYTMFSKLIQQTGTAQTSSTDEDLRHGDRDYRQRQRDEGNNWRQDAPPEPYPPRSEESSSHRKRRRSRSRSR